MSEPLLEVDGLSTVFSTRDGLVRAVDGVSFTVRRGETLGIVGESGSGKSVTALSIMGLVDLPGRITDGTILLEGQDLRRMTESELLHVRGKRIAMIFQEPATSLNPTVTVGEQLFEALRQDKYDAWRRGVGPGLLRSLRDLVRRDRTKARAEHQEALALLRSVYLAQPELMLRKYPFMLSGGMLQRVMITIALASKPDLLIADEPTTALDVTIQSQILEILRERKAAAGLTTIIITHDLGVIAEMCDRVVVMYAGRVVEEAPVARLFDAPRHPYTRGLLASMPSLERPLDAARPMEGSVPDLIGLPANECHFAPRCPLSTDLTRSTRPPLVEVAPGEHVACHIYSDLGMRPLAARVGEIWRQDIAPRVASLERVVADARPLVEVRDLRKDYPARAGFFGGRSGVVRAVDGVTFDVRRGETFALVGESGCGKTTTGELLLRLQQPTSGDVRFDGRSILAARGKDLRKVRRRMQVVFQNPRSSLNPRMRVQDILAEPFRAHGDARAGSREAIAALLDSVGLGARLADRYPHELSGGQAQRIAVARALALDPELVVLDEPTSALDVSVQTQLIRLLRSLQERLGLTYVFISHDLRIVRHFSDRIAVMYLGVIVETGTTAEIYRAPAHPYTHALLASVPRVRPGERAERPLLAGEVGSAAQEWVGCRFRARCPFATAMCADVRPPLAPRRDGREVACHYVNEEGMFVPSPLAERVA